MAPHLGVEEPAATSGASPRAVAAGLHAHRPDRGRVRWRRGRGSGGQGQCRRVLRCRNDNRHGIGCRGDRSEQEVHRHVRGIGEQGRRERPRQQPHAEVERWEQAPHVRGIPVDIGGRDSVRPVGEQVQTAGQDPHAGDRDADATGVPPDDVIEGGAEVVGTSPVGLVSRPAGSMSESMGATAFHMRGPRVARTTAIESPEVARSRHASGSASAASCTRGQVPESVDAGPRHR